MKQETKSNDEPEDPPIVGDVIGDTAYSERFVLKILIKFANLDSLKEELPEKSFEDDLCILWDMTTERDVVIFLLKHDIFKLFKFALPIIDSARIIEIILGIIANMCCKKEAVDALLKMDGFITILIDYVKSEDSAILIQIIRLLNSCLVQIPEDGISFWMDLFEEIRYSSTIYFILKNSTNRELLNTSLENLNTICSVCNVEKYRVDFFSFFVTDEGLDSVATAFNELMVNQKDNLETEESDRILLISVQIVLNLIGFDKSLEVYCDSYNSVVGMTKIILNYYEDKVTTLKEVDPDIVDILESIDTIMKTFQLYDKIELNCFLNPCVRLWKALTKFENDKKSNTDEDNCCKLIEEIKIPLSVLVCSYLDKSSEKKFLKVHNILGSDFKSVMESLSNEELKSSLMLRYNNFKTKNPKR